MSPRAAWRLESLGFDHVFDYVGGIADWAASGRAVEGAMSRFTTAGAAAHGETALCRPGDLVTEAAARADASGEESCLVVNDDGVVLGRLYIKDIEPGSAEKVEDVMDPGPSTFRPNIPVVEMAQYMSQHDLKTAPITSSDGRFVGMLTIDAAEQIAERELADLHAHGERGG